MFLKKKLKGLWGVKSLFILIAGFEKIDKVSVQQVSQKLDLPKDLVD